VPRLFRVSGLLAGLVVLGAATAPAVLAAGPQREVFDLNSAAADAEESEWASDPCGFPVVADMSGHIGVLVFPDGRGLTELDTYAARVTYANPATGVSASVHDSGPDRFLVKDGMRYVAVTGRSTTGTGSSAPCSSTSTRPR
jgi:hypothetical protein